MEDMDIEAPGSSNGTESLERHRALLQKMSERLVYLEVLHSDHIAVQIFSEFGHKQWRWIRLEHFV